MNLGPDPDALHPMPGISRLCFLKNLIQHPNIEIGEYTYYDDFNDVHRFVEQVRYLFDFSTDKLRIGKFCMIASGVEFLMNGANHYSEGISAYPFAAFGQGWEHAMEGKEYPYKGDTVIGHDVWIGYQATILPGVKIGHGAIIGAKAVVTTDIPPYAIVGGNPAKVIRMRFSEAHIKHCLELEWWNWSAEKITANVGYLTDLPNPDLTPF